MFKQSNYKGSVAADSSPSGIEKFLTNKIESALGKDLEGVKIRPLLQVDEYTDDLTGDVRSAFGAIAITVGPKVVHVPFIMKDKEFLPFDSIRMGDAQVPYEEKKLKKLVDELKRSLKEEGVELDGDANFETMELGDIKDLPFDNGFLGTIMSVRDEARRTNNRNQSNFIGTNFGHIEEDRLLSLASEYVGQGFEDFHEKLGNIEVFTESDLLKVANDARERAIKEYDAVIEAKQEPAKKDLTQELYRRQAKDIQLVPHTVVGNGLQFEFPIVSESSKSRSVGRIFRKLERITTDAPSAMKGYDSLLVNSKGDFKLLTDSDPILVYKDRRLSDFKMRTVAATYLAKDKKGFYSIDDFSGSGKISVPFKVTNDYITSKDEDGRIKSFEELNSDGGTFFRASQSTLFNNMIVCEEVLPRHADSSNEFFIITLRDASKLKEGFYKKKDLVKFIFDNAKNKRDVNVSMQMLDMFYPFPDEKDKIAVVPAGKSIIKFGEPVIHTVKKKEELVGISKRASFDDQNKVRMYIDETNYPPTYNISIRYTEAESVGGLSTQNVGQNNINHLSENAATKVLTDLGYTHTEAEDFFNVAKQNGRYAEFPAANVEIAKNYSYKEPSKEVAKRVIEGLVRNTLNAKRYVPVMEGFVADSIGDAAKMVLETKASESLTVAQGMEKRANETRDPFDATVAFLTNMNHHLDKLACTVHDGYVAGGEEVYEELLKVANFISPVSEELYYRQYSGRDDLYKQAMYALDELTKHAYIGNEFVKEASFKSKLNFARDFVKGDKGARRVAQEKINPKKYGPYNETKKELGKLQGEAEELRRKIEGLKHYNGVEGRLREQKDFEKYMKAYEDNTKKQTELKGAINAFDDSKADRNRGIILGAGVPLSGVGSYYLNKETD